MDQWFAEHKLCVVKKEIKVYYSVRRFALFLISLISFYHCFIGLCRIIFYHMVAHLNFIVSRFFFSGFSSKFFKEIFFF